MSSIRFTKKQHIAQLKEKKALTEANSVEGMEMWGPFGVIKIEDATRHLGINGTKSLLERFYIRYYGKDKVVKVDYKDVMEIGYNMRMPEGIVFGCSKGHIRGNRVHYFAKLNLCLDDIKRSINISMKNLAYFGEIITHFRYTPVGGASVLLAFVKVFDVKSGLQITFGTNKNYCRKRS